MRGQQPGFGIDRHHIRLGPDQYIPEQSLIDLRGKPPIGNNKPSIPFSLPQELRTDRHFACIRYNIRYLTRARLDAPTLRNGANRPPVTPSGKTTRRRNTAMDSRCSSTQSVQQSTGQRLAGNGKPQQAITVGDGQILVRVYDNQLHLFAKGIERFRLPTRRQPGS